MIPYLGRSHFKQLAFHIKLGWHNRFFLHTVIWRCWITVQPPWSNMQRSMTPFHMCDDEVYWLSVYFSDCSSYNTSCIGTFSWHGLTDVEIDCPPRECLVSDLTIVHLSCGLHVCLPYLLPFYNEVSSSTNPIFNVRWVQSIWWVAAVVRKWFGIFSHHQRRVP